MNVNFNFAGTNFGKHLSPHLAAEVREFVGPNVAKGYGKRAWSDADRQKLVDNANALDRLSGDDFVVDGTFGTYDVPAFISVTPKDPSKHKSCRIHQDGIGEYNTPDAKSVVVAKEGDYSKFGKFQCPDIIDPNAMLETAINEIPTLSKNRGRNFQSQLNLKA